MQRSSLKKTRNVSLVERARFDPRFNIVLGLASTIGLTFGLLIGIWDGITVLLRHAAYPLDLYEALSLILYAMALYGALGFGGTLVIGVVITVVIIEMRPKLANSWLTGLVLGISAMFTVAIRSNIDQDLVDFIEQFMISLVSGVVVGAISVYLLENRRTNVKLAPLCFSLVLWISLLIFIGLWANNTWQPEDLRTSTGLLSIIIIFALPIFFVAIGIYRLLIFLPQRIDPKSVTWAGRFFVSIVVIMCIVGSFQGPLNFNSSPLAGANSYLTNGNGSSPQQSIALERPNIIWIVMDMVRSDHLSCYGYHHNTTPNIDKIAREGVLFENAFSVAPWTLPSHASMFTGMLTCEHETHGSHLWLDDRFETIAEVLSENGYITLGYSNNIFVSPQRNLAQGFNTFEVTNSGKKKLELPEYLRIRSLFGKRYDIGGELYGPSEDDGALSTNETVRAWISNVSRHEQPFFIFINYMEAHEPLHPPESFAMPFMPEGIGWDQQSKGLLRYPEYLTGLVPHDDEAFAIRRALYDGEISYLDVRIGELLEYLRESNILDETLLIITSDHGENFGEHGLMDHMFCVYDTLIHVPLIIRYPGVFEGGQRVNDLVQLIDIYPTILDLLDIDGYDVEQNLGNSLVGESKDPELRFTIGQDRIWIGALVNLIQAKDDFDPSVFERELEAIRTEEYKYIWGSDGSEELYNIRLDPQELNNLIESEPEVANELRSLLWKTVSSCNTSLPANMQELE